MQALNYKRLNNISVSVPPYRGSLNRFPLGNRKQNTKYFLVGEENGERVFSIVYGQRWKSVPITKEEYISLKRAGSSHLREVSHTSSNETTYQKYECEPDVIGVVRPDNTFEFTKDSYWQGTRHILSDYTNGFFSSDLRRGGIVWFGKLYGNGAKAVIPIYKGMRVNCETMVPTKPITVVGRKVDRKVGKALLAGFSDFYTTVEVMSKAMDYEAFVRTMTEVINEHTPGDYAHVTWSVFADKAKLLVETAPLDAAMLFIYGWDIGNMRWNVRRFVDTSHGKYSAHEDTPHTMFLNLKRKLNKELYKANESVFKKVEYTNCEVYPPSEWGYTVMVDGVEVQQYD